MTKQQIINMIEKSQASGMIRIRLERASEATGAPVIESGFLGWPTQRAMGYVARVRQAIEFLGWAHAVGWLTSNRVDAAGITCCDVIQG